MVPVPEPTVRELPLPTSAVRIEEELMYAVDADTAPPSLIERLPFAVEPLRPTFRSLATVSFEPVPSMTAKPWPPVVLPTYVLVLVARPPFVTLSLPVPKLPR